MSSPTWVKTFLASSDRKAHESHELLNELVRLNTITIGDLSVTCVACWEVHPLREWTFIQNRYYVYSTGCTGGDYWVDCKVESCHIQCPSCHAKSYLYNRHDRDVLVALLSRKDISREKIFVNPIIITENRS